MTTMRKPQFFEEDQWSRVESSKFRPMFAGVNVRFHLSTVLFLNLITESLAAYYLQV